MTTPLFLFLPLIIARWAYVYHRDDALPVDSIRDTVVLGLLGAFAYNAINR